MTRWWNGIAWTENVAVQAPQYAPVDPNQWQTIDYLVPTGRTSGVRALVWGIIALFANVVFFIPSIIAIISGAVGIARGNRLEREGHAPAGRALAVAGLALGILTFVVTAVFFAVLVSTNLRGR
jgi:cytochrome b